MREEVATLQKPCLEQWQLRPAKPGPSPPLAAGASSKGKKRKCGVKEECDDDDEQSLPAKKAKMQVGACTCGLCGASSQDIFDEDNPATLNNPGCGKEVLKGKGCLSCFSSGF